MTSSSDRLVPFRWPSTWTDPAILGSFRNNPINCLVFEDSSVEIAEAARSAGLTVLKWNSLGAAPMGEVKWKAPAPRTVITGLEWPRMKMAARRSADAESGPTGAPWIDSNTWISRLAAVRAPHRPIWLAFQPDKDAPPSGESAYKIAIADSAAAGAHWIVTLDEGLAKGIATGNDEARKAWSSIAAALAFFENHRDWAAWEPSGSIGVLSSFSGKDEFLGTEVLNLAARRSLLYRVLDRSVPSSHKLAGLRAVLYVDNDPPSSELKARLEEFVRVGGLLILPQALASTFKGGASRQCAVTGYELRTFGNGSLAIAQREWEDPYFVAADVHSLVKRRNDPVTLFNGRSLWEHYSESPDAHAALLQLVAFTGRPAESVSLMPLRHWRSATLHTIESATPVALEPVGVDGRPEFHLPPFSHYAALEFRS